MKEIMIWDGGNIKVTMRDVERNQLQDLAPLLAGLMGNQLPPGYMNTTPINGWFSVMASALNYKGVLMTVHVNGGGPVGIGVGLFEYPKTVRVKALKSLWDPERIEPQMGMVLQSKAYPNTLKYG
jgi:hypothetical protein